MLKIRNLVIDKTGYLEKQRIWTYENTHTLYVNLYRQGVNYPAVQQAFPSLIPGVGLRLGSRIDADLRFRYVSDRLLVETTNAA